MSKVFTIYMIDSRGNSMRYISKKTRKEALDRVDRLRPIFPSLKAIEVREESRSTIV